MSWLKNILKSEYECQWQCCLSSANTKINRMEFWNSVHRMKECDYTFRPTKTFIFEKIIHLNNDDDHQSTLSIGLDPQNEFCVAGCLKVEKSSSVLMMNSKQLKNILDFLKDNESNILQTIPIKNTYEKYGLMLKQKHVRILELCMHGWSINIDEDSLKRMCRMRLHIQRIIPSFETQSENCEILFFKLLSHFYFGKTVQEASDLVEIDYKQDFFEEIISFHCDCLDKQFIMEIALHFEQWFVQCLDLFIDGMMLYESQRLQTYSSADWPHDEETISTEKLAKSGLFYVGTSDNVQCAFCGLILHKWKPSDDPILDHFKYKPKCKFLKNHERSLNVSDVGKPSELGKLLSALNYEGESCDEVDGLYTYSPNKTISNI